MNKTHCYGYIQGISDVHDTFVRWGDMEPKFCVPEGENGVTAGQLRKIVVKYLNENPEELHLTAGSLVSNALNEAFPVSYKDDGTSYCPE